MSRNQTKGKTTDRTTEKSEDKSALGKGYEKKSPVLLAEARSTSGRLLVMQQRQSRRLAAIRRSVSTKMARKSTDSTMKLAATHMVA